MPNQSSIEAKVSIGYKSVTNPLVSPLGTGENLEPCNCAILTHYYTLPLFDAGFLYYMLIPTDSIMLLYYIFKELAP